MVEETYQSLHGTTVKTVVIMGKDQQYIRNQSSWYKTKYGSPQHYDSYANKPQKKQLYKIKMALECSHYGRVLDVGCGPATLAKHIKDGVFLDFSRKVLTHHNWKHEPRILASVEQLPFSNKCFDSILASALIEHLDDPKQFIKEAYRVLKDGGVLVFSFPSSSRTTSHKWKQISFKLISEWLTPYFKYEKIGKFGRRRYILLSTKK